MDRPEPGLVKWSPNVDIDSFAHLNLQHRVVQLYEPTGHARSGRFDIKKLTRHDDFPPLTTYDWSPTNPSLLAVGTGSGVVNLLRIDDGSNAYVELGLKMIRTCQAVAFNTTGLLAVGLDRVRMDSSLHIWDVNRLCAEQPPKGFPPGANSLVDVKTRLEPSVSVSSIKFFEDSPQTLVVGIKGQGLRIHDLRDPGSVTTFQTKCNNNLAIDYADQNYFASSALDHPGVMIWDRRATARHVASRAYTQAVEEDELPWGGALRLDKAIESDSDPEGKHSLIRSLRFSRDHRGLLAVLSRTGQLRLLHANKEVSSSDDGGHEGPELLQVQRSYEMDPAYKEPGRKNDRIVSFDWVTLGPSALRPRMVVLRASGNFDILEQPSHTSDHLYKLVPWQAPHRGLDEGTPYHELMRFEPSQVSEMLGPLLIEQRLADFPIFSPDCPDVEDAIENALNDKEATSNLIMRGDGFNSLPDTITQSASIAAKLRALRTFIKEEQATSSGKGEPLRPGSDSLYGRRDDLLPRLDSLGSCREIHEELLSILLTTSGLPREAQCIADHTMLFRAKERYLFDATANRSIVEDDPWTRFVWDWIADASLAAEDGGMFLSNMDLSYLGVHSIWTNDLGRNPMARLTQGTSVPEPAQWERAIGAYCKKRYLPKFDGVSTKRSHHRQLCLEICSWGDPQRHDSSGLDRAPDPEFPATVHTMAACRALFRGDLKQASEILKKASQAHPELLFVSLALQLAGRGGKQLSKEQLDFDDTLAFKSDPYLRAMSALIATGDWAAVANQHSLPVSDRTYVAVRNFTDDQLTAWLGEQVKKAVDEGDVEGIVLTGITDNTVDLFARYIEKFHDVQTATLVLSICYPRYIDDFRCRAWRNAYRALLQRHKLFFQRTKFEVESTKRSKRDGVPTLKPPSRQIALRCVYCDAETSLTRQNPASSTPSAAAAAAAAAVPTPGGGAAGGPSASLEARNPLLATSINAGVSCPSCGRHLPRCVVCLEVVGVPRSDRPEDKEETRTAGRFPTFCLRCEHVLHLDHARQWFARHPECPVPECRCRCNFRANPELNYH